MKKSARFARTFSWRLRAQLVRMSAFKARDLVVVTLCAPVYVTFAFCAQCYLLKFSSRYSRFALDFFFKNSLKIGILDYSIEFFMFIRKTIIPIKKCLI